MAENKSWILDLTLCTNQCISFINLLKELVQDNSVCSGEEYTPILSCSTVESCEHECRDDTYFVHNAECPRETTKNCWCFKGAVCDIVSESKTRGYHLYRKKKGIDENKLQDIYRYHYNDDSFNIITSYKQTYAA